MAAYAYKYVRDRLPQFIIDKQVDYEGAGRKEVEMVDSVRGPDGSDSSEVLCGTAPKRDAWRGGDSYEASMLLDLLAVIHRDGGHYVEAHGLDKAIEDAHAKVLATRVALAELVRLKDIKECAEQCWPGDPQGPGDDAEAIRACLSNGATLEAAVDAAHEARKALTAELERACSGRPDLAQRYVHGA